MTEKCTNIYREARELAGLTREQAVEKIPVVVRTLASYENGETIPPDDVVEIMMHEYMSPQLGYLHLRNSSGLAKACLPEIRMQDFSRSVLLIEKEVDDFIGESKNLRSIACDGYVSFEESEKWGVIKTEVQELAAAALGILCCSYEKEKTAATVRTA